MIIEALQRYGFEWDGEVSYQSTLAKDHQAALAKLVNSGAAYRCTCSRRDLASAPRGPMGIIYPGNCRDGNAGGDAAIRIRTHNRRIDFSDRFQGPQSERLESESGDFVISRRDGLIAYHLAVVVDDAGQGVTDIVRGIDLMPSTVRQIHLQQTLDLPTPRYAHIPVVEHPDGSKLSKLTGAPPIPLDRVSKTLFAALAALGQEPPAGLEGEAPAKIWQWAIPNWRPAVLQGRAHIALQHYC